MTLKLATLYRVPLCSVSLCQVSQFIYCYAECRYSECHNAECRCAHCRYADCRGAVSLSCLNRKLKTTLKIIVGNALAYCRFVNLRREKVL